MAGVGGMRGGEGGAWQGAVRGVGGMHGGGHVWWGACMVGGCVAGGGAWQRGMCGRYHEIRSMSGRYASYWNAFLSH